MTILKIILSILLIVYIVMNCIQFRQMKVLLEIQYYETKRKLTDEKIEWLKSECDEK